ncbi:MAG: Flp pilus assembly complex ATPase component TadA [Phycisphaerales bacterium]|nr:Flp pilus assembly complex ATPase component TadA [Phycisphaerales bacterium]
MAHLEIRTKNGVKRLRLDGRVTTLGRNPESHLQLKDSRSSRDHCVIEPVEGGFQLRDLGSRNGTRVNNRKVSIELLDHQDVIRIGRTVLKFVDESQTRPPKARPRKRRKDFTEFLDPAELAAVNQGAAPGQFDLTAAPGVGADSPPARHGGNGEATTGDDGGDMPLVDLRPGNDDGRAPYEQRLREIISSTPTKTFEVTQISLIDTRGQTVHQAMSIQDEDVDNVGESIRAFRLLLLACFNARATDLHLEPKQDHAIARMRVDGYMVQVCEMNRAVFQRIYGLVKILCQIDTSRKNVVQEGHFSVAVPGRRVDYRVSFTPSMHGQKLVIRVLDTANAPTRLHELGLVPWMYEKIRALTTRDAGMLLSCGPTGSGKTTTLYSCLREVDVNVRNVITIEDPVEYSLEGCTQIPVDSKQGNSFGQMLRSVLRQDPDVIYVGEIRDSETAKTAMQAAMTGHLVLSTVHAKDSIGAIFRLLDLGVEPYLVANSVNLILAQRLVRLLCPTCKKGIRPTPSQVMKMGRYIEGLNEIWAPIGCKRCLKTGFLGRCAIFELLELTDELRDVVLNKPAIQEIRAIIKRGLFHTLQQSGFQLVARGLTSADEIERVAGTE